MFLNSFKFSSYWDRNQLRFQILVKSNNVSKPTKSFRTNNFIGKSSGSDAIADFDEIKIFNRALSQEELIFEINNSMFI